ncbi:MAG: phosphoribosylamine--glycine ligase [Clostridiales bacterium]|nr:phosphoribosylamine--glycine ligase [Clostridiales bacterium]
MKLLVVGGGGREHAIIKKLKENPSVTEIYALPGNGGMAADATCVPIGATDLEGIVNFVREHPVDYAVVTPDDPLVLGCVDRLNEVGVPCFGPRKNAAIIEGSKAFSKDLMKKYGIPTARYETFSDLQAALDYVSTQPAPLVVKADGLALGKGVLICQTREEAAQAVTDMMANAKFGASGSTVVIEEFLEGPEVSVLSFTDGKTVKPMVSSMDHKRAGDGDTGLNTGGMGTVAPNPYYTPEIARRCMEEIFLPTIRAMEQEGRPFTGCLYFGLMLTKDGPKVIEYNCRFGDPETQVVLPLMESDLLTVMKATTDGTLAETEVKFSDKSACCVVTASKGYPLHYEKGFELTMTPEAAAHTYVAGAKLAEGKLLTAGGRVTGTTAVAATLPEAIREAYRLAEDVRFQNAYRRSDIGQRALAAWRK